jgi:hypothetical protein
MKSKSSTFGRIHLLMTDLFPKSFFIGQNWPLVAACSYLKAFLSLVRINCTRSLIGRMHPLLAAVKKYPPKGWTLLDVSKL